MPERSEPPRIALLCPTSWDRVQLPRLQPRISGRFDLVPYGPDAEADPAAFDADEFVERAVTDLLRSGVDAVTSSSDYPGCLVAAVVAERLDLPGPQAADVLRTSHKYYARQSMSQSAPDATPRFTLIDISPGAGPPDPQLHFPFFVKPVKSWFSQQARIIHSSADLAALLVDPQLRWHLLDFVRPFNQLLRRYADSPLNGSFLIAEEILTGRQVTVEGYVLDSAVRVTGIVDSIMHPGTLSFERFVYPSSVPPGIAPIMIDIVDRVVRGLGLRWTLFNVELIYDPTTAAVYVVEVNPRMCGQFADLMEAVNGVNTYELLCEVALGRHPATGPPSGQFSVAASFPRRRFADGLVVSVPTPDRIARVIEKTSASLIVVYYRSGQRLSDNRKHFDGGSFRYATINLGSHDRESIGPLAGDIEDRLGILFGSTTPPGHPTASP